MATSGREPRGYFQHAPKACTEVQIVPASLENRQVAPVDAGGDPQGDVQVLSVRWNWWRYAQSEFRYREAGEIDLGEVS
jgi:hypothetical protein